jgi:HlyD family secretion protein
VFRVVDGRARATLVQPGASNGTETQILDGLSAGDLVVLHPTSEVQTGARVRTALR